MLNHMAFAPPRLAIACFGLGLETRCLLGGGKPQHTSSGTLCLRHPAFLLTAIGVFPGLVPHPAWRFIFPPTLPYPPTLLPYPTLLPTLPYPPPTLPSCPHPPLISGLRQSSRSVRSSWHKKAPRESRSHGLHKALDSCRAPKRLRGGEAFAISVILSDIRPEG